MKTPIRYLSFVLLSVAMLVSCSEEKSGKTTEAPIAKVVKPEKKERPDLPAKSDTVKAKPVKRIPTVIPPDWVPDPYPHPWPDPEPWPDPYPFPEPPPPVPPVDEKINRIVDFPDVVAEFPGGPDLLTKFIRDNLVYPDYAKELGVEGRVFLQFVVEKDGSLTDVTVARGVSPELDNEAKRIIRAMPKWIPATSNGEKVRSKMIVPFKFSLE